LSYPEGTKINTVNRQNVTFLSRRGLRRQLAAFMAMLLCFSVTANPVLAQSVTPLDPTTPEQVQTPWGSIDIDPPVIDHEALESGTQGQPQEFSAIVVDDRGLKRVWLFHRDTSGAQYASVPMQQVAGTSEYKVTIDSQAGQNRIEYYIEAVDTGGNRVLKGFPFFPLVRQLNPIAAERVPAPSVQQEESGSNKAVYVVLGVAAAVGIGLALLAGGGGDDGGGGGGGEEGPDTMPEPGTVPLTIVVSPPE